MKKLLLAVAVSFVLCGGPAFAQAVWCYDYDCQYLEDHSFSQGTTYWDYSSGSGQATVTDPCAWGSATSSVADLDPGDSVFQTVYTDEFPNWGVQLDIYKTSTSVTSSDYYKVIVHNYTTLQTETNYVYAGDYSGLCAGNIWVPLAYDHSNSLVRVRIEKNSGATATMYVDNVTFYGTLY